MVAEAKEKKGRLAILHECSRKQSIKFNMHRNALPSRPHSTRLRTKEEEGDPTNEQEEIPSTETGVSQSQPTLMLQWMQQQEEMRRQSQRGMITERLAREERMQ